MRKFKLISTVASMFLLVAMLAFGVWAATSISFTVSSTVSFNVTNVYIKAHYGLVDGESKGPFYSDEKVTDGTKWVTTNTLPDFKFTEESATCTYFVTFENLHGMAIHCNFNYTWTGYSKYLANDLTNKNGAVTVVAKAASVEEGSSNYDFANKAFENKVATPVLDENDTTIRKDVITGTSGDITLNAKATVQLQITLTLKGEAMNYVLKDTSGLTIVAKAGLTTNDVV